MNTKTFLQCFRSFRSDRRANVAVTFGIALVPIFGLAGLAVDYTRATGVRASMQAATDATALMLAKEASKLSSTDLNTKATQYFNANFKRPEGKDLAVTPTLTNPRPGNWTLTITATGKVDTMLLRAVSFVGSGINVPSQLNLSATSQVHWGMKKLELALALDNTRSMLDYGKMTQLKIAVNSLLDTLKQAEKVSGDIKISIIPFDTRVNIGTSYKDKPWFDYDQIDCGDWRGFKACSATEWKSRWDGCVRDRTYPYDTQDDPPVASNRDTLYPVDKDDCGSLTKALPLTADWTALRNKVSQMTPNGTTNVTIGLVWAWHALTKQEAFTEASEPKYDLDKVIILLTDGLINEAWDNKNNREVTSSRTLKTRLSTTCSNIRSTAIKVYTVRVIEGDEDVLKSCATNMGMYYDVQNANQLNAVFTDIANSLANLYIAK